MKTSDHTFPLGPPRGARLCRPASRCERPSASAKGRGKTFAEARPRTVLCLALLALTTLACRQDMHDQPRYEPLERSSFFETVARAAHKSLARSHEENSTKTPICTPG